MELIFWGVVLFGSCYSFAHAYYLWRDQNKVGAFGITLVGILIGIFSFMVDLQ